MSELLGRIIVIKRSGADGAHFPLRSRECLFGRNNECDIRIQLPNVSKEHARITVDAEKQVWLSNISTCQKTLLNGTAISKPLLVNHLDVFTISDRSFRFEFPTPPKKSPKKSPKSPRRQSGGPPLKQTQDLSPKVPTPQGSPRTPLVGSKRSLKENIHILRRQSATLQEVDESVLTPLVKKSRSPAVTGSAKKMTQSPAKAKSPGRRASSASRKRVSFGPMLSPEQFDKDLPPATPVRRGTTPRRTSNERKGLLSDAKKRRSVALSPKTEAISEECEEELLAPENVELHVEPPSTGAEEEIEEVVDEAPENVEPHVEPASNGVEEEIEEVVDEGVSEEAEEPQATPRRSSRRLSSVKTPEVIEEKAETPKSSKKVKETVQEARRRLATPMRTAIESGVNLKQTKKKLATPLRKEIQSMPSLRETKKKLATPLRKEIQSNPSLRETKKKLATPLREEILSKPTLRETKKKLATPLREEILSKPTLRETKKKLATPLREEILSKPTLRETKKKLATPLREEILSKPTLRETKKKLATPLREEITSKPKLRQTKKVMLSELQDEIKMGTKLQATKKVMPYDMQIEIIRGKKLKQTMKKMGTPLREEIKKGVTLRETKKSLPTPLKDSIKAGAALKETKKKLKTPLRQEIRKGVSLRETKKKLPSELQEEIVKGTQLKETKKKMATPMKKAIQDGLALKKTKQALATPLRKEIESKPQLKAVKRKRSQSSEDVNSTKKLKKTPRKSASKAKTPASHKKAGKTPSRKSLDGFKVRQKRLATPLRRQIQLKPALRRPTYAEVLKRTKARKTPVRRPVNKLVTRVNVRAVKKDQTKKKTPQKPETISTEVPAEKAASAKQSRRNSVKKPITAMEEDSTSFKGVATMFATPVNTQSRPSRKSLKGTKEIQDNGDCEGLQEMFATPEPQVVKNTRKSDVDKSARKSGNWLDVISKSVHGVKGKVEEEADMDGLKEMFATPEPMLEAVNPTRTPSLRSATNAPVTTIEVIEAVESTKTPSLRAVRADTAIIEAIEPIVPNKTPSMRKRSSRNWLDVISKSVHGVKGKAEEEADLDGLKEMFASPEPIIEAINPTRTPSLRSAKNAPVTTMEIIEAAEPTKTPSLRAVRADTAIIEAIEPIVPNKTPSMRKRSSRNWLDVISKSVHGVKGKAEEEADLDGLKEMFASPEPIIEAINPTRTPSLKSAKNAPVTTMEVIEAAEPTKTPSLRSVRADTAMVEAIESIVPSKTPSLRSPSSRSTQDSASSFVVADFVLELPETPDSEKPVNNKTRSKRQSEELTGLKRLVKTPKVKSSAAAPEDSYDPSLFNSPVTIADSGKKRVGRKSAGLSGLKRFMKTPKTKANNSSSAPEDNFDPAIFASPMLDATEEALKKSSTSSRRSVGLTGLKQLTCTPKENNSTSSPESNFETDSFASPALAPLSPSKARKTRNAVAEVNENSGVEMQLTRKSLGLTGISRLFKSPKIRSAIADVEDNFEASLFGTPVEKLVSTHAKRISPKTTTDPGDSVVPEMSDTPVNEKPVQAVSAGKRKHATPQNKSVAKEVEEPDVDSGFSEDELPQKVRSTRGRRALAEKSTAEPKAKKARVTAETEAPKGTRSTRSKAASTPQKKARKGRKAVDICAVVETPKPTKFSRTALDPILEVLTPKPTPKVTKVIEEDVESAEPQSTSIKPVRGRGKGTKVEKAAKATRGRKAEEVHVMVLEPAPEPVKSTRATRGRKIELVEEKPDVSEVEEEAVKPTRTSRGKKPAQDNATKTTRATRGRKAVEEVSVIEVEAKAEPPTSTRSSRAKKAEAVEEEPVITEDVPVELPKRARSTRGKKANTTASVEEVEHTGGRATRGRKAQNKETPDAEKEAPKAMHNTRNGKDEEKIEVEVIPETEPPRPRGTRGRKVDSVAAPVEAPKATRSTRGKKGQQAEKMEEEVPVGSQKATRSTRGKQTSVEESLPAVKPTRATRGKKAMGSKQTSMAVEEKPSPESVMEKQDVEAPKSTRSSRAKKAEMSASNEPEVEEPPKTRGRRGKRSAPAKEENESEGIVEEQPEAPKTRRGGRAVKATDSSALNATGRGKKRGAPETPAEVIPEPKKARTTRTKAAPAAEPAPTRRVTRSRK